MGRYFAVVAGARGIEPFHRQKAMESGWSLIVDNAHLLVAAEDAAEAVACGPEAAIIGTLFGREGKRLRALDAAQCVDLHRTDGRSLTSAAWGHYVAFCQSADDSVAVLRDPLGSQPCYFIDDGGGRILMASEPDLLLQIARQRSALSWDAVGTYLAYGGLRSETTCLQNVRELEGGMHMRVHDGAVETRECWSPWTYARRPAEAYPDDLRAVIEDTLRAWTSCYPSVLLTASGGLDSSIVAAGLKAAGANLALLTMATDEPDGDERAYVQILADHLHCRVIERFYDLGDIDLSRSSGAHLPQPNGRHFLQCLDKACAQAGVTVGADAYFNGSGGDNIFCMMQSATPVTDRYLAEGLGAGLKQTIVDVCDLTGATFAAVVRQAVNKGFTQAPAFTWRADHRLLSPQLVSRTSKGGDHRWLSPPPGILPGKAVHVGYLLRVISYNDGLRVPGKQPTLSPLLSQPIVEYCLSVPTWEWVAGGRNRSLARRAFVDRLPEAIVARQSKGGPDAFSARIFEMLRDPIRTLLLDGAMAKEKIFNRDAVEALLRPDARITGTAYQRLLGLADTEAWARGWM